MPGLSVEGRRTAHHDCTPLHLGLRVECVAAGTLCMAPFRPRVRCSGAACDAQLSVWYAPPPSATRRRPRPSAGEAAAPSRHGGNGSATGLLEGHLAGRCGEG